MHARRVLCLLLSASFAALPSLAADWPRFRGPNGSGVSPDTAPTPVNWTATENVKWTLDLPGPGSSCPIVVGDKVFVTCWSGYGLSRDEPGDQANLKRHLICVNRADGKISWEQVVDPYLPEDKYAGMFAEHGYASHTPTSDGEKVFAFFGKTGVVAFDMNGEKLWQTSVGTDSEVHEWGTAASPILYENLVIVPAMAESHALFALDKESGDVVWKQEAQGFEGSWSTPILVSTAEGKQEIVLAVPGELWALDPKTGKLLWYAQGSAGDTVTTSAIPGDGIAYVVGGRDGGTVAVRAGGSGDVTETATLWSSNVQGSISTPLLYDGKIYSMSRAVVTCIDAETGDTLFKKRLEAPPADEQSAAGQRESRGGGFLNQSYASPVAADGKMYYVTRQGLCYVFSLEGDFEQLAVNKFGSDDGDFSASPAISDGEIFIRSSKKLYCVSAQ